MFTVSGDQNGRRSLPGRPMLDPVTGFGFLVGLGWAMSARADRRHVFWLVALAIGILPSALAVDGPHSQRSIAAIAPACVLSGIGWACLASLSGASKAPRRDLALAAVVASCAALAGWNTVFRNMATDPRVWGAAYPVPTQMGLYVRQMAQLAPSATVYLPADVADNTVITYLAHGLSHGSYDASGFSRPPQAGDRFLVRGGKERARGEAVVRALVPGAVPVHEGPPFPGTQAPTFVEMSVPD
jgi:hypothetical protein